MVEQVLDDLRSCKISFFHDVYAAAFHKIFDKRSIACE